MGFFKNNKKNIIPNEKDDKKIETIKKKKMKLGLGLNKKNKEKQINQYIKKDKNKKIQKKSVNEKIEDTNELEEIIETKQIEEKNKIRTSQVEKKEPSIPKKRKTLIQKDYKNKPVFLEDTGEKLGIIFDMVYDEEKNLIAYKIKDNKSDNVLSFPINQFEEDKNGLIFTSGWYNKALKIIEKFEFKDRISPELTTLLKDEAITHEELYSIFLKHDDEMAKYMEETMALKEMLNKRLSVLERERIALKENLMDLTEKRLIKDIDRREFSEDVSTHRHKVNVLDVNIKKCKQLLERLDKTSFGCMVKMDVSIRDNLILENNEKKDDSYYENKKPLAKHDVYKEKYFELQQKYEKLEEDYNELKIAVEKLVVNNE